MKQSTSTGTGPPAHPSKSSTVETPNLEKPFKLEAQTPFDPEEAEDRHLAAMFAALRKEKKPPPAE